MRTITTTVLDHVAYNFEKSKCDWIENLTKLRCAACTSARFKAKDFGLSGSAMSALRDWSLVEAVGEEEIWFKVNYDTMKRGTVKIWECRMNRDQIDYLIREIKKVKISKVEDRIYNLECEVQRSKDTLKKLREVF